MSRTLVVTPLESELRHLYAALTGAGWEFSPLAAGELSLLVESRLGVVLARGGHGKAQFAVQTRYLLDHLEDVALVVCAGAAGGLQQSVVPGDIVVATETVEHDYRLWSVDRPPPRFAGHGPTLAALRGHSRPSGYRVRFGPTASGDEDIIDLDRVADIVHRTGALAVAWEGAGGARACALTGTPYLEVRGVTDRADPDAPGHFADLLESVMANLADFLNGWLASRAGTPAG